MAVETRTTLISKGVQALAEAEKDLTVSAYREAELKIRIAQTYANLAGAAGNERVHLRDRNSPTNW